MLSTKRAIVCSVVVVSALAGACDRQTNPYGYLDELQPPEGARATRAMDEPETLPLDLDVGLFDCNTTYEHYGVDLPFVGADRIAARPYCFEDRYSTDHGISEPNMGDPPVIGVLFVAKDQDPDVHAVTMDTLLHGGALLVTAQPGAPIPPPVEELERQAKAMGGIVIRAPQAFVEVHGRRLDVRRTEEERTFAYWEVGARDGRPVPFTAMRLAKPSVAISELERVLSERA